MELETSFAELGTYYDVLDIPPSATSAEVREAYLRAKSAYKKDSLALYSLIDTGERENILQRIEEAYEILANEEKRKLYDSRHGILESLADQSRNQAAVPQKSAKIVSIDRVPPMEFVSSDEEVLVAPRTDFSSETLVANETPFSTPVAAEEPRRKAEAVPGIPSPSLDIDQEITDEKLWKGSFIRRVREARGVSIEEMSNITKISKTYINALEQEDFKKLPAFVFVRGFIIQICRVLKIPIAAVTDTYLERYKAARIEN